MSHVEAFTHYLTQEEGLSPNSAKKYTLDVLLLRRWIDERHQKAGRPGLPPQWEDVTAADLREFMAAHKPAPARSHRIIASWRKFWGFLRDVQRVPGLQPGPHELKRPKMPARLPKYLTTPDVARLLDVAYKQRNPRKAARDWAILAFLYGTGTRISEAVNLTFNKITYTEGLPTSVNVVGKGNKERNIILSSTAQRALLQWLRIRKSEGHATSPFVFSNLDGSNAGKPFSVRTIEAMIKRHGIDAGLPAENCTPHKLRHAHATALLEAGRGIEEVKEVLGHASIATTQIYTHVSRKRLEEVAAALPDVLDVDRPAPTTPAPKTRTRKPAPVQENAQP